jgi:hypothetical protein
MNNVFTELEYLSNPSIYEKYKNNKKILDDQGFQNDKIFYKKRIIQLTKDLYNNNLDKYNVPLSEIQIFFDKYIFNCIQILKLLDKNDELQVEYKDFTEKEEKQTNIDMSYNVVEKDKELFKLKKTNTIEDCYPIKKNIKNKKIDPPKQKEVNLKDPKLKLKGLKKKNKTNIYE